MHPAMKHILECPAGTLAVFLLMFGTMDLSPVPALTPIPPQALDWKNEFAKAFYNGIFPGRAQELLKTAGRQCLSFLLSTLLPSAASTLGSLTCPDYILHP